MFGADNAYVTEPDAPASFLETVYFVWTRRPIAP